MESDAFRKYLEDHQPAFKKWGEYVSQKINALLICKLGAKEASMFVKIPTIPRVKEIDSALGKIGRKNYIDPVVEMTDLVGVRFVLLLSEHINVVREMLQSEPSWVAQVSKDYLEEIDKNPKIFDYQSQHFEVRPKTDFEIDGIRITKDMCCEVQIRTLLQHAYAELVHDSIYKPVGPVPNKAERQVAKSMALMETTDDLFCSTMKLLTDVNQVRNCVLDGLKAIYREEIGEHFMKLDSKTNYALLDEFREVFNDGLCAEIRSFVERKRYISRNTQGRAPTSSFFSQPVVLLAYWLVQNMDPDDVKRRWPLPGYLRDLNIIFSDLDRNPSY